MRRPKPDGSGDTPMPSSFVFFHEVEPEAVVRTFVIQRSPYVQQISAEKDIHTGRGLTPVQVLASLFDDHRDESAGAIPDRLDEVLWEEERVVGLRLNTLNRPQFFGGQCLCLAVVADGRSLKIDRVEPGED